MNEIDSKCEYQHNLQGCVMHHKGAVGAQVSYFLTWSQWLWLDWKIKLIIRPGLWNALTTSDGKCHKRCLVFLLLLSEIFYLTLICCFEAEIPEHFQQEECYYFAGEKSGQRIVGFHTGGELRAESIPNGSWFYLPNYTITISNLISKSIRQNPKQPKQ